MNLSEIKDQLVDMVEDALSETGAQLKVSSQELAEYMAQRAEHLASIVSEPGYSQALRAERNNIALKAGLIAGDNANEVENRLVGMIGGALRIVAAVLVAVA